MKRSSQSPKSRNGCQRCKDKRVKCDETKPECTTCVDDNTKCPGYGKPLRWSRKHELDPSGVTTERPTARQRRNANIPSFRVQPAQTSDQDGMNTLAPHATRSLIPPRNFSDLLDTVTIPPFLEQMGLDHDGGDMFGMPAWMDADLLDPSDNMAFHDFAMGGSVCGSDVPAASSRHGTHTPTTSSNSAVKEVVLPMEIPELRDDATGSPGGSTEGQDDGRQTRPSVKKTQDGVAIIQGSEGVRSTGSLLHTFYRLSLPSKVPGFSEMDFVCHYFKHVCRLYSCFDSRLNPFRKLVADRWSSCATIFYAIQSMAIAHIANWYPYIAPLGLKKRTQAYQSLQQNLQLHRLGRFATDNVLLSLLLLGISSGWHQGSGLGIQQLSIARSIIQRHLQAVSRGSDSRGLEEHEFFEGALIYWEMLASFVDPVPIAPFPGHGLPMLRLPVISEPVMPHPWTGLIPELHFVLAEVGRLLRRWRGPEPKIELQPSSGTSLEEADERWAATLSRYLIAMELPSKDDDVVDYEDIHTPRSSLVRMTAAYRDVALLELYHLFPVLLRTSSGADDVVERENRDVSSARTSFDDSSDPTPEPESYTTSLAMQIVENLDGIPVTSGACRLQPLVLLSAACQLRSLGASDAGAEEQHEEVMRLRYVAEERFLDLTRKFPQRPLQRMMDILKEAWSRLDTGSTRCHWMEVMYDREWQILMG